MERKEKEVEKLRELGTLLSQYAVEASLADCESPPLSFNPVVSYLSRSYL